MTLPPDFISDLQKHFTGDIRLDLVSRILYSTDASIYQMEPLGVVLPKTQEDLHCTVELAAKYQIPILPRGSGSSLAGQAVGHALIIDCSRYLDNIIEINPEARTATVEPGVILAALNRAAAKHGLQFGPDPASAERATLGGVVGNNATGAHSILYGMTADHLLSADVIMADGSLATWGEIPLAASHSSLVTHHSAFVNSVLALRKTYASAIHAHWPSSWRNSAGYRLNYLLPWSPSAPPQFTHHEASLSVYASRFTHEQLPITNHQQPAHIQPSTINLSTLLAGSEGTLAVMRRVTINLVQKPRQTVLALLQYDDIAVACDDVPRLLEYGPSAVELVPQLLVRLARNVPAYAAQMDFVEGDPAALIVVEFSGSDPALLEQQARQISPNVRIATAPQAQSRIWNVRKVGLGIFDSRPVAARPVAFIEDCAIPAEQLGDFVREVERILAEHGTTSAIYAHASAGCLHIRPILDLRSGSGVRALRSISEQVLALTLRLGGSMSSEHGDGLARSEWLRQTYGDEIIAAFTALKRAADPHNLLNPGKIVAAPLMDDNLRYGDGYQAAAWSSNLHFDGGLTAAIEQCNGQGVCRKNTGTMCPSFQATREEMHSTRGRANLLRALISLKPSGLPPEQVKAALDLCLACKGCKAECPSSVDMAKLKYEFQNHYYQSHRRSLRDYLFGYINQLVPLGAPFGRIINYFGNWSVARRLAGLFGISGHRPLPKFGRVGFKSPVSLSTVETVIFLPDTFTRYFEPEIESAAMRVLAACNIRPQPLPILGAGRTLLSKGFLEPARRHAEKLLDAIHRLDPDGKLPIIGIEPSELYTLRDELRALLPHRRAEVDSLAARALLIDEYLLRPSPTSPASRISALQSQIANQKSKIVLHGHCYQKAQPPAADGFPVGQEASAALLRAIGCDVEIIPSGCCGMAGAFGYETEHYEVSQKVGELVLLPAVRQAKTDGKQVVAVGTSCRSQILDGAEVAARHPIQLVADRLS
jgi:FAD/FMN-containing dehydrogenase/Fe-S oxidoreductase